MGKTTPSSEEKDDIGDRVPEVRMMEREHVISEKAWVGGWEGEREGGREGGREGRREVGGRQGGRVEMGE